MSAFVTILIAYWSLVAQLTGAVTVKITSQESSTFEFLTFQVSGFSCSHPTLTSSSQLPSPTSEAWSSRYARSFCCRSLLDSFAFLDHVNKVLSSNNVTVRADILLCSTPACQSHLEQRFQPGEAVEINDWSGVQSVTIDGRCDDEVRMHNLDFVDKKLTPESATIRYDCGGPSGNTTISKAPRPLFNIANLRYTFLAVRSVHFEVTGCEAGHEPGAPIVIFDVLNSSAGITFDQLHFQVTPSVQALNVADSSGINIVDCNFVGTPEPALLTTHREHAVVHISFGLNLTRPLTTQHLHDVNISRCQFDFLGLSQRPSYSVSFADGHDGSGHDGATGLAIFLQETTHSIRIRVTSCNFSRSYSLRESSFFLKFGTTKGKEVTDSHVAIENSTFEQNHAMIGGGLYAKFSGKATGNTLLVSDCHFQANTVSQGGAGFMLKLNRLVTRRTVLNKVTISMSTFFHNRCGQRNGRPGGALFAIKIKSTDFFGSESTGSLLTNDADLTIQDCLFSRNGGLGTVFLHRVKASFLGRV